ncbi:MAG: glycosyltransferase [Dehalococcoidia bacterium]
MIGVARPGSGSMPRVLTWHVHGSYLYYLSRARCQFILPTRPGPAEGYGGRSGDFDWPDNVIEVPAEAVRDMDFDVVLTQSRRNYLEDRFDLLTVDQLRRPLVHLEHDPPRESPAETRHFVEDERALLVHVTPFNALMWDSGAVPARVIEHGVEVPAHLAFRGDRPRAITAVNNLARRGRRLGPDVFDRVASRVPVDLVGMNAKDRDGIEGLRRRALFALEVRYRCFFYPVRYTSLGLAVLEAMMLGLPVVGLATTELATVIQNGRSGYIDTDIDRLTGHVRRLVHNREEAARLGAGARAAALNRFSIERFADEWTTVLEDVASRPQPGLSSRRVA